MNDETLSQVRPDGNSNNNSVRSQVGSAEVEREQTIAVAATFTADLITRPLQFWMEQLEISATVVLAPYAQLMQELLNPQSLLSSNERGFIVLMVRLEDWIRDRLDGRTQENLDHLRAIAHEFGRAVALLRTRSTTPLLVHFCPASAVLPDVYRSAIDEHERKLVQELGKLSYTHCSTHAYLMHLYPLLAHENAQADRIAHIPYTQEYFVALATLFARRIAALTKPQYKVVAVDCDNTLWQGVCGEDGAAGVKLTPAHIEFQRMLVRQHDAGVLLCICSKNNPADVEAVFRAHPEMPLREEHLICSRVNWKPKSENLRSLAKELGLALDSFILVDDSGLECAEVQANCPGVLTLQMPQAEDELLHFINHVWAFDRIVVTQDAKHRTAQYRQNRARRNALSEASDLRQFLASLELKVDVAPMQSADLARVAELVQRTNQFNLTTIRRRASEIEALSGMGQLQSLVVRVRDRFGDYGLVGALLLRWTADALDVDTFVLSCRVLGREVEYRVVNELGRMALSAGRDTIVLRYRRTSRNVPAWTFLENSFSRFRHDAQVDPRHSEEVVFRIPSEYALHLTGEAGAVEMLNEQATTDYAASSSNAKTSAKWHEAAYRFSRLTDLMAQLGRVAPATTARYGELVVPQTSTETAVAQIWTNVLGISEVGLRDDFFELGGDSLLAVQVIASIGSVLGLELSIYEFFEAPTVEQVARKLARSNPSEQGIHARRSSEAAPLSSAQQRLWFIDRLEGGSTAYHIPLALRLRGELHLEALQAALNGIVGRHEVLRTVFVEVNGEPMQRVLTDRQFVLQQRDLRGENDATVLERLPREVAVPFDLSTGPLVRGALLRLKADEHILLITMHHMVSDGWSLGVLTRELDALYGAYLSGASDPLPSLPIQYADYALWQRQRLAEPQIQEQLEYWKEHLQGAPALMDLPTDRLRPATQSYHGANVPVVLGPDATGELKALARQLNVTLAMVLYTAWSIVLMRLSNQADVVIGMPVAGRRRTEFEPLIGYFVNTLAVRVRCEDDPSVYELLMRVKEIMLGAQAHQDVPFELVVEALRPLRTLSFSPVFQVMLAFHNAPTSALKLPDLITSVMDVPVQTAQFDLSLNLQESAEGVAGVLNYASDLFDGATIRRWVEHFRNVLKAMTRKPREKASAITLLGEDERHRVIEIFNATQADYPAKKLLHELFEAQVDRTPEAVAVVYEDQSLTYGELNAKANQLARYLRKRGIGPDQLVGMCVERSVEMVLGLLGILKAGGAYVPLDPTYPRERLDYMLKDAAPALVLTQRKLRERLPETAAAVIALDADWPRIAEHPSNNFSPLESEAGLDRLAYVIYTSGSTGRPKGAMIDHDAVLNLWSALETLYGAVPRIAVNASFNFDASVQQFVQLLSGRTLYVLAEELRRDIPLLIDYLIEERIGGVDCTPSQLNAWLTAGLLERAHDLRTVLVGGEAIDAELWSTLARGSKTQFFNVYGPTECTVDATVALLNGSPATPNIGRPMPNRRVYLLDRHLEPVPIGVAGEIYIGGAGVGRGYWRRSEMTVQRYLPDPYAEHIHARMYKTGDLGRWRADGMIEYLGRNDDQVKIRGFRIELGEIEGQLTRHAQVKEAVVIAREDAAGEKRLVAYVVPSDSSCSPTVEELRAHLKAVLPEYMVPSACVMLERMPLMPNGKLDRRSLPAPELEAYVRRDYEAPQGDVEEIVAEIWQSLLQLERVGRQDNFFELGGHSLLIVQMIERLRRVGLMAELRRVFESPTLADLACALRTGALQQFEVPPNLIPHGCVKITPDMLPLVELEAEHIDRIVSSVRGGAANIQDIYPLTPLQEGMLFHHLLNRQGADTYVVPTVLSVATRQRLEQLIAALQTVIDRHDVLRTAVLWEQLPQPLQVVYRQAAIPVEMITLDRDRDPAEQIQEWIAFERQRIDLQRAPLMRLQAAEDVHGGQWYALLQLHHIIGDNASQEVVIAEIVAELNGRAELMASVPYRNHVAQVLAYARTHDAEEFFRHKLSEIDEPTAPFGLLDVHGDGSQNEEIRQELDLALARRVRAQARRYSVSAATLFHAAWGLVVAHTSARDDVVFGSVLLGRLQGNASAQQILGMFINTLPLRLQLGGMTARHLIEQTQRELVELLSHEHASLAVAQRCSGITGSAPLFTALLNFRHSISDPRAQWSSASGIRMIAGQDRTNYPITLSVDDLGEGFALSALTDRRIDPQRIIGYLRTAMLSLVEALERAPQAPALELSILPPEERRQLLEVFNATQVGYPRDKLVHELFEEQVERTPHEIAVICGNEHLTYRQLNCRANQLARYLQARGAQPDRFIGLCAERGVEMVLGLLGILKAGGAYVPLDPNYPQNRLEYILDETAPVAVLTQARLQERLPEGTAAIAIDAQWEEIAKQSATNLCTEVSSDHLAYVIYTSGSTGQPKGVAIEHRNAVNLICWAQSSLPEGVFEETLQSTSLNFDLSVYECFVPLSVGGRLRVVQNALTLVSEPAKVTLINTVPSAIQGILNAGSIPASARVVNLAGEALKKELVDRIFANSTVECVCNLYGPSETTTYSTSVSMPREQGFIGTIGHPVANTQIYILDAHAQPVPLGVVGEIYIGGAGVARGYLNRPALTAQRFIPDPFGEDPKGLMYKTGDLGRWRTDGSIEYLGRNDHQVKIRGFRIELGEIEAQLARHAQVKEAVVLAREDVPGEKRLVGYVVGRDPHDAPRIEALREQVKSVLPEYMVPSAFVLLDRMPLTPNGKLDRRALPAPEQDAYMSREYETPQGEVEEILAGIWQSLLNVERVGRRDNFFELGGHSLLIVQMRERLRRVGLSTELRRVFENPTLAALASVLASEAIEQFEVPANLIPPRCEAITPEMLPLVELEPRHIERIVRAVPGGAANIQDIYPLAPLQEGILFHHLFDQQRGDSYVLATMLSVASRERLDSLIAALQVVIDRHDVLRTAVLWEELPRPVQVVQRRAALPVEEIALEAEREAIEQIRERIKPERLRLDIRQAPLVRLQIASDPRTAQWYAVLQFHHIAMDHVTLESVTSEVVTHLQGQAHQVLESVPYRNHVAQSLAYARQHDAEAFFRGKLADVDEPSAPFGLLDVHGDGAQVEEAREEFEPAQARRVRAQARRLGVSAATLFHAAWGLVIAHTSAREDVVFGSVLLGRLQGNGAQRILGMFINTLPLRLQLQGVTAKHLVEQTQRELVELLAHEQASLAAAQRCSGVTGSVPLFTALFNYRHSIGTSEAQWSKAAGIDVLAVQERTNYPITLSVDDLGEGFALSALTDRRIDPQRINGYLRTAMLSLVEALEDAPHTPALQLSILPQEERRQLLEVFNATQVSYPQDKLIHELFEEQVERTPDTIAVIHNGSSLTYAQLNSQANRLARYLRNQGVDADRLVGICIERSLDMVVSVLGTLKAGCAYVPLDPNYPSDRLLYMLQDAAPQIVLTLERLKEVLPETGIRVVTSDTWSNEIGIFPDQNLPRADTRLDARNLVYVIYTSGSTGRPKGTAMVHRAMVNLIEWHRATFDGEGSRPRVLQFAALSFDVAFQEAFSTLCTGGTLVLLDEWVRRDPPALLQLLGNSAIERLFIPPLMLQSLAEYLSTGNTAAPPLRDVITAGEQLLITPEIMSFFEKLDGCRLHNHYGPTETHVVTALTLEDAPTQWPAIPTIGRPIANSQIYVLDRRRNLAPVGVVGEIYIGGANVARGYRDRPELTAERLVCDPFRDGSAARMYRTGDLGRWRPDGTIEYLGRNDDQVKIRGFRIELGEVETHLARHSLVREVAVVAREDVPGEKRLVAYYVASEEIAPSAEDLREHLRALVPDYMVPSAFVQLDELPLTPSGKLNRRALPSPDLSAYATVPHEAPQGDTEEALARIWRELLGVEQISREDDFFDLGGHSLLALKALLQINQYFGCVLRVADLYQHPTLQELAACVLGSANAAEFVDLSREAMLDESITACAEMPNVSPRFILLTGATGFVGRFLLTQLLQDTDATIYCLTRARSDRDAAERLSAILREWGLWHERFGKRIVAIAGDLGLARLGIDEATYKLLAQKVDGIYHCGTSMNHLETYASAKPASVGAVREILKLATWQKPKLINYISTLGVFSASAEEAQRLVDEETPIEGERYLTSQGYIASKWVAEKILLTARERGIPCNIFRLGLVWADARLGRFDDLQHAYRLLKSCFLCGYGIENYHFSMPPTPVDYVVRSIVTLAREHGEGHGLFHISSSRQMPEGVFERCNAHLGTALTLLPYYDWIVQVKRLHLQGKSLPIVPLIEFAFEMNREEFERHQRSMRWVANIRFDFSRTHRELEKLGVIAPVFNDGLLARCVEAIYSRDVDLINEQNPVRMARTDANSSRAVTY